MSGLLDYCTLVKTGPSQHYPSFQDDIPASQRQAAKAPFSDTRHLLSFSVAIFRVNSSYIEILVELETTGPVAISILLHGRGEKKTNKKTNHVV